MPDESAQRVRGDRLAGVAVPLFSLRSEPDAGIGEIDDLIPFLSWAASAGQRIVALLPLGEVGPGEASPYNALSSFAIDPVYLRPATIPELRGRQSAPRADPGVSDGRVDRDRARAWKEPLFRTAFERFETLRATHSRRQALRAFQQARSHWLGDYSLFRALLEENDWRSWKDWPEPLRGRDPRALEEARARLARRTLYFEYLQFTAEEAWRRVREIAARRGVALMGDLPFAPSENSADVWAHPEIFDGSRSIGAPPDDFSAAGQRWGLPMIRWTELRQSDWRWLRERARRMTELYDLFRVDHVVGLFRTFYFLGDAPGGFAPAEPAAQAEQGREILQVLIAESGAAKPVAEDLGTIPPFVRETIAALDIPGYKVLRWERDDEGFFDPSTYPDCSIATTGTHDTSSLAEWWEELPESQRRELIALAAGEPGSKPGRSTTGDLTPELRRAVLDRLYRAKSRYVVLPIQDLFGWCERINVPATSGGGNWTFRLPLPVEKLRSDPLIGRETRLVKRSIDASGRLRKMDTSTQGGQIEIHPLRERRQMEEFKTGSVRANGLQFQYLEAGSGPLVLCLHGFPDHARSFRFQLPALAKAGFRAVAPYLRGYAPTDVPAGAAYQTAALANDTVALIEALSPREPAYVFGHDWGAGAAYGAAILTPSRIRKLVTAAVPHGPQLLQAFVTSYEQMRRSWYIFMFQMPTAEVAVSNNDFELLDKLWRDWSPGWTLESKEMAALKETFRKPGVLEAALSYYRHTFNPAFQRPELADLQARQFTDPIDVPALVFHGEKDGCIGVETLDGMEAYFPKGLEKVRVPGAGHFVHQEKPDLVNARLISFLKGS